MMLFIKLLLAHLLGDFIFQPDKWVLEKRLKKQKSKYLYFHCIIHGILAWILVFRIEFWPYVLIIIASHYLIDLIKLVSERKENARTWFFVDQLLHLLVLATVSWAFAGFEPFPIISLPDQLWLILLAAVSLTFPSSILIKMLISKWTPLMGIKEDDSLQSAGKYIGILERLLIVTFIASHHWEGIGFLIAAKSIFRFSDLKESRDRKMTEYILIGTLLSFGLAIMIGLLLTLSFRYIK